MRKRARKEGEREKRGRMSETFSGSGRHSRRATVLRGCGGSTCVLKGAPRGGRRDMASSTTS